MDENRYLVRLALFLLRERILHHIALSLWLRACILEKNVLQANCFECALLLELLATAQLTDLVVDGRHERARLGLVASGPVGLVLGIEGLFINAEVNWSEKVSMQHIISVFCECSTEEFDTLGVAELEGEFLHGRQRSTIVRD